MADPQTSRFWKAALQSGLIDVAMLRACWEALPVEKREGDQLDRRLARQAVQAKRLTIWQAQQLLSGRSSGFKIDRYILLDLLGQGGMGRVYLARDSRLNRNVALKILSPERVNNPRAIARFQREARVGAQLQHENLVRIYDEGESGGKCYLVMEYIEGKTIGSMILEKGPMPPSIAARLVRQVALGLEHAQLKGLIHRDVNPFNILVTRDGTAKLTDLGLAIDLGEEVAVTRDGATVGTFDYISPEQARHSHSVDTRSDIYSLGCSLYHMLAGQVPFPAPSLPEKLLGHQVGEPAPITATAPSVPPGLVDVVRKMMRKAPDERYASPLEVAQALEPFAAPSDGAAAFRDGTLVAPGPGGGGVADPRRVATTSGTNVTDPNRRPQPATEHGPADAKFGPAGPAYDLPPTQDMVGIDLNLDLDLGPRQGQEAKAGSGPAQALSSPPDEHAPPMDFARIAPDPPPKLDLSGLGLSLDLGPEPARSEGAGKTRARPSMPVAEPDRAGGPAGPAAGPAGTHLLLGMDRRLVLGGASALLIVAVAGGLFASGVLGKPGPARGPRVAAGERERQRERERLAPAELGPLAKPGGRGPGGGDELPRGQAIAVKAPDGTLSMESDLKSAMQRAIGSRGHVLLNNREPLKLSGADAALRVSGGPLYIHAAAGARPVIEVEIRESKPFLSAAAETPLEITGVTIVARYVAERSHEVPAVIEAFGNVKLERCALKATGTTRGTRALSAQGTGLTVSGCWFEDFERPIDVVAFAGSSAAVRQCMMVRAGRDGEDSEGAGAGAGTGAWAVRVRSMPGGAARVGRRLVLDHCTVQGPGLLELADVSPQFPYRVEVKGCAVMSGALLAWEPRVAGLAVSSESLQWTGEGNLYDISGKSWVVGSAQGNAAGLARGPGDLASWSKLVKESAPLPAPIKFRTDPSSLPKSPGPEDFAILEADSPVGADPDRVGPAGAPAKKS